MDGTVNMEKTKMLSRLTENGVIAVVRGIPEQSVLKVAQHLVEGGVNVLEITLDSPGAYGVIEMIATKLGKDAIVGAGTVLDSNSTIQAINSGADFVVSPCLQEDVIKTTLRYGKIVASGALTPTEMVQGLELGADFIKVFPATSVGPRFIKDVRGPLPHISIIPTGGINLSNVADFIGAGAVAVGVGGDLLDKEAINSGYFEVIREQAAAFVEKVKQARIEKHKG